VNGAAARDEVLVTVAMLMLPIFGVIQTWLMTPTEVVTERPPAPPSTSSPEMAQEVAEVRRTVEHLTRDSWHRLRLERRAGTYARRPLERHRGGVHSRRATAGGAARTYALLNMAMHRRGGLLGRQFLYFNPRRTLDRASRP
jgi:hypothetical protein